MYRAKACAATSAEVRIFCESVSETTTQNIRLLKAIEQTVDWLVRLQRQAKADGDFAMKAADHLKDCERLHPIDVDGTLCALFEEAEEALQRLHALLSGKREAARMAPELVGDHKKDVVDEYTNALSAVAYLHNAMADLRWAVGEHDADLEKPEGPEFSNRDELKAYLEAL